MARSADRADQEDRADPLGTRMIALTQNHKMMEINMSESSDTAQQNPDEPIVVPWPPAWLANYERRFTRNWTVLTRKSRASTMSVVLGTNRFG